ncbi:MAG: hypothetical protein Q9165_000561 [Trypethelium subeluteriae]
MVKLSSIGPILYLVAGAFTVPHDPHTVKAEPVSTLINLGYATYQGTSLEARVNQYLGLRYAAPPVGDRRWRAPEDPVSEDGTQDATKFGPICVGTGQAFSNATAEDCLYINVFTPSNATATSKLPVWVYIQGGGYATNANANYNGTQVVMSSKNNIVLVNFNYRVGAFGFLASEKVRANGTLNVGLLDQRKALEWVQKYIELAQFGGDPDHVVIHGASAGAGSIAYQLTAYGGRDDGLFVGAIAESPFFPTHRTVAEMEFQFDRFTSNVSCNANSSDVMTCLRSQDAATLQRANVVSPYPGRVNSSLWYFLPVVDGDFSPDLLYNLLEQGKFVKVPTIVGDDTDEGESFAVNATTNEQFLQFLVDNYPNLSSGDLEKINASYPLLPPLPAHALWFHTASQAYGDSTFTCAGNQIAMSVSNYTDRQSSWNYHYNVMDNKGAASGNAVPHTAETPAIFGPPNGNCKNSTTTANACSYYTYNMAIVPVVMDYWISFVRSLDPNTYRVPGSPVWENWGAGVRERRLKFQINDTVMEDVPSVMRSRCDLWRGLASITEQ